MASAGLFCRVRSMLAPMMRPVLEHCGPLRAVGLGVLGRRQPDHVEIDGQTFHVNPRDFGVTFELHSTGEYETVTRGVVLDLLQPGMTFIDVGAHVGLFSVPAARRVGATGRVISFEPDADNRALLERNVGENVNGQVVVVPAAVCDQTGDLTLYRSPYNTGDHQLFYQGRGRETVTVPATTLDDYLHAHPGPVDVIKMDVQGAEGAALRGMRKTLVQNVGIRLCMEFSPSMLRGAGDDPATVLNDLVDLGFDLVVLDEVHGRLETLDAQAIAERCPDASYVNILCTRSPMNEPAA